MRCILLVLSISLLQSLFTRTVYGQDPSIFNHGSRDQKKIALTFDADMTPYMSKLLKTGQVNTFYDSKLIKFLIKQKIPATFFLTGMWTELYPQEAKKLANNPLFEIGNHSYSHPGFSSPCWNLATIKDQDKSAEITLTQKSIQTATGITPRLFRFPGGCSSSKDQELVTSLGLKIVGWDLSSTDAFNKHPNQIISHVQTAVSNGSILVFHLGSSQHNTPSTYLALLKLIPILRKSGYQFIQVGQM